MNGAGTRITIFGDHIHRDDIVDPTGEELSETPHASRTSTNYNYGGIVMHPCCCWSAKPTCSEYHSARGCRGSWRDVNVDLMCETSVCTRSSTGSNPNCSSDSDEHEIHNHERFPVDGIPKRVIVFEGIGSVAINERADMERADCIQSQRRLQLICRVLI